MEPIAWTRTVLKGQQLDPRPPSCLDHQIRLSLCHKVTMGMKFDEAVQKSRRSRKCILAAVLVSILTDILLYGTVLPVLPFILSAPQGDGKHTALWNSTLIACHGLATFITALPIAIIADYVRHRGALYRSGLLFSVLGTVLLCVGRPMSILLVGRALQGVGSSFVWITGLAVLADTFRLQELGVVLALVDIATSLGSMLGPVLGGALFVSGGYHASFGAALGLLSLDVILRCVTIIPARTFSPPPSPTSSNDFGSSKGPETIGEPPIETSVLRRLNAGTTVRLLRARYSRTLILICLVVSLLQTALDALLPLFVKDVFDWTASSAGLVFLTFTLASCAGMAVGRYVDRHGTKWFATCGLVMCSVPLALLRVVQHNTTVHKATLCVLLVLIGLCFALIVSPTYKNFTNCVNDLQGTADDSQRDDFAQAYSLMSMAYSAGCFLVFLVTLVERCWGWSNIFSILGCVSVLTAVPAALWVDRKTATHKSQDVAPSETREGGSGEPMA